ncbi:hypothetical protein GH733_002828 [Mirounga leonina]|nr:hypothetical protein GH733_002828 [Mirounga leonina]
MEQHLLLQLYPTEFTWDDDVILHGGLVEDINLATVTTYNTQTPEALAISPLMYLMATTALNALFKSMILLAKLLWLK